MEKVYDGLNEMKLKPNYVKSMTLFQHLMKKIIITTKRQYNIYL